MELIKGIDDALANANEITSLSKRQSDEVIIQLTEEYELDNEASTDVLIYADLAESFLHWFSIKEGNALKYFNNDFYYFNGYCYELIPEEELRQILHVDKK